MGEAEYTLEYTRFTICKAEEAFGISLLRREEPKSVKELTILLKSLLYGALLKHHPNTKIEQMDEIYEKFISDEGYEQEALVEGLIQLLTNVLNPTGGGRKKTLFEKK